MSTPATILSQIKSKLRNQNDENITKTGYTSIIFGLTKLLESNKPKPVEFHQFVIDIHDLLIKGKACMYVSKYVCVLLESLSTLYSTSALRTLSMKV